MALCSLGCDRAGDCLTTATNCAARTEPSPATPVVLPGQLELLPDGH